MNIEIDDFLGNDIFISDIELKSKPQLFDKIRTKKILSDFGIKCEIPDFNTIQELNNWKKQKIKTIGH